MREANCGIHSYQVTGGRKSRILPMRIFRLSCASAVGEGEGVGELEEIKGWVSGDQKVSVRDPLH